MRHAGVGWQQRSIRGAPKENAGHHAPHPWRLPKAALSHIQGKVFVRLLGMWVRIRNVFIGWVKTRQTGLDDMDLAIPRSRLGALANQSYRSKKAPTAPHAPRKTAGHLNEFLSESEEGKSAWAFP